MKNLFAPLIIVIIIPVVSFSQSTGNVGIGITNPENKLQIGALPSEVSGNDLAIGNGTNGMSFFQSTASGWYTTTNFALMPGVGGTGYLGIGTTTPAVRLHIYGNGEILRLNGSMPILGFYDAGGNYKGYVWNKGANDMEMGTGGPNVNGNLDLLNIQ